MMTAEKGRSEQMQQVMETEDQSTGINLFTEETHNSLINAGAEEKFCQLNQ